MYRLIRPSQRDEETQLDFAEARMYENRHARFTAVDPLLASGKSANPQTFNRYVYVMNNPLAYTDPSGLQAAERVYVSGEPGNRQFRIATKRPKGFKEFIGNERVNATDGYTYEVTSRSFVSVGKWNQSARSYPLTAPSVASTPSNYDQLVRQALSDGFERGKRQVKRNAMAAVPAALAIAACVVGCPALAALTTSAAASTASAAATSTGGSIISSGLAFGVGVGAAKLIPVNGTINVGGMGEEPNVTNINNENFREGANIPNLIYGDAQNIGELFEPNSGKLIISNRFPVSGIQDWNKFGEGAYTVLKPGGMIDLRITTNGGVNSVADGLNNAGFQNVEITPLGDERSAWIWRITATKPNQ